MEEFEFEYKPGKLEIDTVFQDGRKFISISAAGAPSATSEKKMPKLPETVFYIAVPGSTTPEVTITGSEKVPFRFPYSLLPVPETGKERKSAGIKYIEEKYSPFSLSKGVFPAGNYSVSGPFKILNRWAIRITVNPFSATSPDEGIYYKSMNFRIRFKDQARRSPPPGGLEASSVKSLFLNKESALSMGISRPAFKTAATDKKYPQKFFDNPYAEVFRIKIGDSYEYSIEENGIYSITASDLPLSAGKTYELGNFTLWTGCGRQLPAAPLPSMERTVFSMDTNMVMHALYERDLSGSGFLENSNSLLFYGKGANYWEPDTESPFPRKYTYKINPHTNKNVYWLVYEPSPLSVKRMSVYDKSSDKDAEVTTQLYPQHFESNSVLTANYADQGRKYNWNWSLFTSPVMTKTLYLDYKYRGGPLYILPSFNSKHGKPLNHSNYNIDCSISSASSDQYSEMAHTSELYIKDTTVNDEGESSYKLRIDISSRYVNISDYPYLDYIAACYETKLEAGSDKTLNIFGHNSQDSSIYKVTGFSSDTVFCFDITDERNVAFIANNYGPEISWEDAPEYDISSGHNFKRYVVTSESGFLTPSGIEKVNPPSAAGYTVRDLGSVRFNYDYLILTPEEFSDAAEELAEHRASFTSFDTLSPAVIHLEDIYNQYNAGKKSPFAIRNFLNDVVMRNGTVWPVYAVFMGTGTYDPKGYSLDTSYNKFPAFGPCPQGLSPRFSETDNDFTDELFAVFPGSDSTSEGLFLGRLPAYNRSQASAIVEKIASFDTNAVREWHNSITYVADDDSQLTRIDEGFCHTDDIEDVYKSVAAYNTPRARITRFNKIYLANYLRDPQTKRKPDAEQAVIDRINSGTGMMIYFGHGGEYQWSDENIMNADRIKSVLDNQRRLPLIISGSCTVGRFEQAGEGLSEALLNHISGGASATVSAVRGTNANYNKTFIQQFLYEIFNAPDNISLGMAFRQTKRRISGGYASNSNKYMVLGDPALFPFRLDKLIKIDSISKYCYEDSSGTETEDTLTVALDSIELNKFEKIRISGSVINIDDSTLYSDYDGFLSVNVLSPVYKSSVILATGLGTDTTLFYDSEGDPVVSAEGIKITGGKFNGIIVTKASIPVSEDSLQLKIYSSSTHNGHKNAGLSIDTLRSGSGSTCTINIGDDTEGPAISFFTLTESGSTTDTVFLTNTSKLRSADSIRIKFSDQNGVDIRSRLPDMGVWYTISNKSGLVKKRRLPEGYIDYAEGNSDISNAYGKIVFDPDSMFYNDKNNTTLLTVYSTDFLGNLSKRMIDLEFLESDSAFALSDVFNFPNPFSEATRFYYKSTIASGTEAKVKIFTQNGRLAKVLEKNPLIWDGRDENGRLLANGVYYYKLIIKNKTRKESAVKKLMILR
ncbi:MAG: C25 family cysteine peptidase [Fibrobacterota bacterium]